jgi:formylglycine-generating enzyme
MGTDGIPKSCCMLPPRSSDRSDAAPAAPSGAEDRSEIVWFKACSSYVGTDRPVILADGEGPVRKTVLRAFGIDKFAVTNERFARFIKSTGYVTDAQRFGWSYVFKDFVPVGTPTSQPVGLPWWHRVEGAAWNRPFGPASSTDNLSDHPVVHVSWNDATAFANWAGGRVAKETEWEHAARAGSDAKFPWGNAEPTDTEIYCNIWQGRFPEMNSVVDGYAGTAPANAFGPNPAGLYNMCGNTWEWCEELFQVRSLSRAAKSRNKDARTTGEHVLKGGSYLCHISYCYRYRIAARMGHSSDTSTGHIGFRLAYDGAS